MYKTPLYNTAFNKFVKSGTDNLTPEELDALNSEKADYGYRFPCNWATELFKNINVSSVLFPEVDHRQPGVEVDYDKFEVSLFASNAALNDPVFSVDDELMENLISGVSTLIDQKVVATDTTKSIKGIAEDNNYAFVDSKLPKKITEDDLVEMIRRHTDKTNLKWYMNSNTALKIVNPKIEILNSRDPKTKLNPVPGVLLGIQVVYDEYMPDLDSGKIPVILADMKASYVFDIQDYVYLSRTSTTINSGGETVDGIRLNATFTLGGHGTNGDTYRCLRIK
jgi:HK97 family phage major capsid protein